MVAIDTCSLVNLVRYYLPFDKDAILFSFIKNKIEKKEIFVIDKVYDQCRNVSKGIVTNALPFLKDNQYSTIECLPDNTFFYHVNNTFINPIARNRLKEEEIEVKKREFLEDADVKLLLFCIKNVNLLGTPRIVTEETEGSNDNKLFKKIPTLCKTLNIKTITLPSLLIELDGIDCLFKGK